MDGFWFLKEMRWVSATGKSCVDRMGYIVLEAEFALHRDEPAEIKRRMEEPFCPPQGEAAVGVPPAPEVPLRGRRDYSRES